MTVGAYIQNVFDMMGEDKLGAALGELYQAVQVTAQKHYDASEPSAEVSKRFLKESMVTITTIWLGNIIVQGMLIPVGFEDGAEQYVPLEEVLYGILESAATDKQLPVVWRNDALLLTGRDGYIHVSTGLVWGLVMAVVTDLSNKDEKLADNCWINTVGFKYLVNDLWGKSDFTSRLAQCVYEVTV